MTTQEFIEKNYPNGCGDWMLDTALQEYAKIKCQELLEIVAEKAKTKSIYPHYVINEYDEFEHTIVDKDSILNCVDLENFCS